MIVCPYTVLHPDTKRVLSDFDTRFVRLDSPTSYADLFVELTEIGETTVIVEHDVVPTREQLETITSCDHDWCGFSYWLTLPEPLSASLGCMRFSGSLLSQMRGLFDGVPDIYRHWRNVDQHVGWIAGTLADCVFHKGKLTHHHGWAYEDESLESWPSEYAMPHQRGL